MNDVPFSTAIAVAPTMSLLVVLAGTFLQNATLNDIKNDLNSRFADQSLRMADPSLRLNNLRDALRSEMGKNHSELLARIADHEHKHHG